jgi:hypothetical protein
VLEQWLARFRLDIQQQIILAAEHVGVSQNASLRVEEKCIAPFVWLELLDLIGGHGVQQARAVFASDDDFAAGGEIEPSGGGAQGVVAG